MNLSEISLSIGKMLINTPFLFFLKVKHTSSCNKNRNVKKGGEL